ncbi:hypothetical protein [Ectopseudomonas mendocina]|jgi:hypothetical protein|nr:hypothetical protein [Pseudomonas mendocina]
MNTIRHLIACLILTPEEQALLQSLRRLSQSEQQFIRRAVDAMAQHPVK